MAQLAMAFDYELCINCKACVVACKEENGIELGADKHRLWIDSEDLTGDYYSLKRDRATFKPTQQCQQCTKPFCLPVCPVDAIDKDKNGIVTTDADKCILCLKCIDVCPYEARYVDTKRGFADKCIFCSDTRLARGETTTACQITCPAKVRIFGDLDDKNSEISQILKNREYTQIEYGGNKPHLFYLKPIKNS